MIEFDDGTYGIVDYKTSDAKEEHAAFYSRQISAYAYALENPAPKAPALSPVRRLVAVRGHTGAFRAQQV